MRIRTGIGLDSHRFEDPPTTKKLHLGGLIFDDAPGLAGNSDADVILHALTDALSGVTGRTIIGEVADRLCAAGTTDSAEYLKLALADLGNGRIQHISIAIEGARPKIDPKVPALRQRIAELTDVTSDDVCITATTGEGLSDYGKGLGLFSTVVVTVLYPWSAVTGGPTASPPQPWDAPKLQTVQKPCRD